MYTKYKNRINVNYEQMYGKLIQFYFFFMMILFFAKSVLLGDLLFVFTCPFIFILWLTYYLRKKIDNKVLIYALFIIFFIYISVTIQIVSFFVFTFMYAFISLSYLSLDDSNDKTELL